MTNSVHSRHQQLVEDQRQFFDELITEEWDSYRSEAWDFTRRLEVARLLGTTRPARILDIGCGCGFHDVEFARRPFVEQVDAIDYSSASIAKANEAYPHDKVTRRVVDLVRDRPSARYDLVVSFQVIEHLPDPDAYFRFAVAACRPGGRIVIVTPNRNRLDNRLRRWRGQAPVMLDPQHFREYTVADLAAIGKSHGLVLRDSFGYGFHSFIYPALTPSSYRVAARLGAMIPPVATVIGVVLERPADTATAVAATESRDPHEAPLSAP